MISSDKMWWAKKAQNVDLEWETICFLRENPYCVTENHEGGRSPTERLRGTLKVLIESNLTIRAWTRNLHCLCKKVLSTTENFWVIPGQREVYTRPDFDIVFSQQQTTSADTLNVERRRRKLREFELTAAIIRRMRMLLAKLLVLLH